MERVIGRGKPVAPLSRSAASGSLALAALHACFVPPCLDATVDFVPHIYLSSEAAKSGRRLGPPPLDAGREAGMRTNWPLPNRGPNRESGPCFFVQTCAATNIPSLIGVPFAHAGHWIGQVLALVPVVVIVLALAINWWRHRDDPDWYDRDAEEDEAKELDEILNG